MKKKNITLVAICLFAVLMIPLGCKKDFLTQTNQQNSTASGTFTKSQDVVALVNSIYDSYQNSDLMKKSIWYYANFFSHDWYNDGADVAWNSYTISPTFGAIDTFWRNAYIAIARANSVFGIVETAKAKGVVTPNWQTG